MSVRGLATIAAAGVAASVFAGGASAALLPAQKVALQRIAHARAVGAIDAPTAASARGEIARAARLARDLPSGRSEHVAIALEELADFPAALTEPRVLELVGQLAANDDYFTKHYAPADKTDITDADGLVYRYFAGRCFEFHPLADFGALNALVAAGNAAGAQQLADALIARGVYQKGGGIAWEYDFSYSLGRAPWLSGMAQAVAAQAFARTAQLVPTEATALMREAHAAYRAIPGHLLTSVAAGPWIRLYSFTGLPVLNAQLQAVISLQSYATAADDPNASALAASLERSAVESLSKFDTGYWTYYSLAHDPTPLDYSQFVLQLLTKLAPEDPRFADARTRFASYLTQPPAFMVTNAGLGTVRFWLSKPSTVTANSGAGPSKRVSLDGGWHTLTWAEPKRAGSFPVHITAVDWAGNSASFDALPIVRAVASGGMTQAVRTTASTPVAAQPSFAVGAGLDDPTQASRAQKLGLRLVRMTVTWTAGATTPDPAAVAALQQLPAGVGLVLELAASPLPPDAPNRAALAQYAASLAQQLPNLRDLVLTPAPTAPLASAYAATLTAVRSAVQAVAPTLAVGASLDGTLTPKTTVPAFTRALAAAGGAIDVVAFRPAPAVAKNMWTSANVPSLLTALGNATPVLLDGVAVPTTVPTTETGAYAAGVPATTGAASPAAQATAYASAITTAACSPSISGLILDRVADSTTAPVPPSGLYYASGDAKPSAAAVAAAVGPAQRGTIVCPGISAPVIATTLTFPTTLAPPAAASVVLGCTRDCLYLVTLDRADGSPVVARRGALQGGAAPLTIGLPRTTLKSGTYRLDVRIVAQVNPGPVTQLESDPLLVD